MVYGSFKLNKLCKFPVKGLWMLPYCIRQPEKSPRQGRHRIEASKRLVVKEGQSAHLPRQGKAGGYPGQSGALPGGEGLAAHTSVRSPRRQEEAGGIRQNRPVRQRGGDAGVLLRISFRRNTGRQLNIDAGPVLRGMEEG